MSSITTSEAANLSISAVRGRYYVNFRPTDHLFDILPFVTVEGHELKLSTVPSGSVASDPGLSQYATATTAGGSLNSTMPTVTALTFAVERMTAELPINSAIPGVYGSHADITQALVELKVNAVRDLYKKLLARGDSTTAGEFDGLKKLASDYTQELGANASNANGGTVQAGEIEELLTMLDPRSPSQNCYLVMNARAYKHLVKNNYTDVEYVTHEVLGTIPAIAGVPILIDNYLPLDETKGSGTDLTSIYAVMLGEDIGLAGITAASAGGDPIQVRGPVVKEGSDLMWYHVSWDAGLACYNKGAIARLNGVAHGN